MGSFCGGGGSVSEGFGGGGGVGVVGVFEHLLEDGESVVLPLEIVLECGGEEVACRWCWFGRGVSFEDVDGSEEGLVYSLRTRSFLLRRCCQLIIFWLFFLVVDDKTLKLFLYGCDRWF